MRGSPVTPEIDRCYRALELDAGASVDAVKDAWRDLTKVWHPDRFTHDAKLQARAQARMQELNKARRLLEQYLADYPEPRLRRATNAAPGLVPINWIRRRPLLVLGIFPIVALFSAWAARSPFGDRFFTASAAIAPVTAPTMEITPPASPQERSMILVARGAVRVTVTSVVDGGLILPETYLEMGATITVARPRDVFVKYSAGENLAVEIDGKRYDMPSSGPDRARIR